VTDIKLTPVPNRGGRPRAQTPCTSVSTWVPATYHDRLVKMADARGLSVSRLVKQMIVFQLHGFPTKKPSI
jgi:hypothetical protein